jgi:hypothetical protein
MFSAGNITTYGVSLPLSFISCEPLLCAVFETANNSQLLTLTRQVYLAHEAFYNARGRYRAFSEGGSLLGPWAWEWVVLPDNRTWVVLDVNNLDLNMAPIIYTKIAVGFLAIYNSTYAKNMSVYLEQNLPDPKEGYCEGVDESGSPFERIGIHTNGLILGAARYAIQKNP